MIWTRVSLAEVQIFSMMPLGKEEEWLLYLALWVRPGVWWFDESQWSMHGKAREGVAVTDDAWFVYATPYRQIVLKGTRK